VPCLIPLVHNQRAQAHRESRIVAGDVLDIDCGGAWANHLPDSHVALHYATVDPQSDSRRFVEAVASEIQVDFVFPRLCKLQSGDAIRIGPCELIVDGPILRLQKPKVPG
jgi:hypothetical protein